jgi:NCAIR mutase (PurE)-related protein
MFPTKNLQSKYDFNKIQQIAINIKKNYKTSNKIDEKITDKIIEEVKDRLKVESKEEALVLITGVLQKGGSNKNAINSIKFEHNNKILSAQELQQIVNKIQKNVTNRQFARAIANDIAKISLLLEIEGDLSNQIKYEYPNLSLEEAV